MCDRPCRESAEVKSRERGFPASEMVRGGAGGFVTEACAWDGAVGAFRTVRGHDQILLRGAGGGRDSRRGRFFRALLWQGSVWDELWVQRVLPVRAQPVPRVEAWVVTGV